MSILHDHMTPVNTKNPALAQDCRLGSRTCWLSLWWPFPPQALLQEPTWHPALVAPQPSLSLMTSTLIKSPCQLFRRIFSTWGLLIHARGWIEVMHSWGGTIGWLWLSWGIISGTLCHYVSWVTWASISWPRWCLPGLATVNLTLVPFIRIKYVWRYFKTM